jgi:UTP:GlnB (protein PII) uridylyltransferase
MSTDTDTAQRVHGLVEELRAEVDFEIDDVIANIVRNLPEEYFASLAHEDQLTHLKALLAISICNLKRELTLRSEDDRHIAVIARQNYPGLLAKIIHGLPDEQPLIGAKIFTSKTHDFIIDLFEFKPDCAALQSAGLSRLNLEDLISEVAKQTGATSDEISQFVSFYPPCSRVLESTTEVSEHFLAFREARTSGEIAVRWSTLPAAACTNATCTKITVSTGKMRARDLFQATARFLSQHEADIEQAFLDDFPLDDRNHIAVSSFVLDGPFKADQSEINAQLVVFLRQD